MVRLCDTVAQYPCLKISREVLSTNGCGRGVSYPYPVWEEGMPVGCSSGVWDKESGYVTSSYG
jgi:hypothetical protein